MFGRSRRSPSKVPFSFTFWSRVVSRFILSPWYGVYFYLVMLLFFDFINGYYYFTALRWLKDKLIDFGLGGCKVASILFVFVLQIIASPLEAIILTNLRCNRLRFSFTNPV